MIVIGFEVFVTPSHSCCHHFHTFLTFEFQNKAIKSSNTPINHFLISTLDSFADISSEMIVSILETINEFEPFGRLLMPFHPKQNGLLPLDNISFWTSAETDSSRDLFRSPKAAILQDNTPVIIYHLSSVLTIYLSNYIRKKTGN